MKITRRGTTADHGESSIELRAPIFSWSKPDSCIAIRNANVRNFNGTAHHGYTIEMTVAEVNDLMQVLSGAAISDPVSFEKFLEPSLKAITRMQAVVTGLKT